MDGVTDSEPAYATGVLTMRAAAGLLAAVGPDALTEMAAACGCRNQPLELDADSREALGFTTWDAGFASTVVRVARGPGH